MTDTRPLLLDSDVFITAKNLYYAFDICPGFWMSLLHHHRERRVFSISRVRGELLAGRPTDEVVQWVRDAVPDSFFLDVDTEAVITNYTEVILWIQRHPSYVDGAKAKFATGADGWLVAYAKVHRAIVITNEQPAPSSKNNIKLPDVCDHFGVQREHTFWMLRELGVRLEWDGGR